MGSFLDKWLSKSDQENLATYSRKIKKELSELPLVSAIGDGVQGASGLGELKKKIQDEPNEPIHWLFYYEALVFYKKLNSGVSVGRGIINPVGFVAGKGVSAGLNSLDDEYEAFNPSKCIGMSIALTMKRIKNAEYVSRSEDYIILSKALAYSSMAMSDMPARLKTLDRSIDYTTRALQFEANKGKKAEYLFYLAQFYEYAGKNRMKLRTLNMSRKMGFKPADDLMKDILKKQTLDSQTKEKIDSTFLVTPYKDFIYTHKPDLDTRVENTYKHVVEVQGQKLSNTGKRLNKFFNNL
ncbi:hypothetical protein [Marinococcus sp. PL1-022]|uniref:hypothetical protein n=1 Tax=Marinococcus sp. PL1-022 TaxID=3095363 RepID=UPI0029C4B851|nr:hypothetical protein [Marinococcus sp. PL1-022]MDX6153589.1 hypothetical protein [Marinococcus sp. PL1-022]